MVKQKAERHPKKSNRRVDQISMIWSAKTRGSFAILLSALFLATTFTVRLVAEVKLSNIFDDHMVLQRDRPLHFWGMAEPNELVSVSLHGETQSTVAGRFGQWSVNLSAQPAGGPYVIKVRGQNEITLHDVLIGDVWVASGQSNMAFTMAQQLSGGVPHTDEDLQSSNLPQVRFVDLANRSSEYPLPDVEIHRRWTASTPDSVPSFSAVAYFFARSLQSHLKVPIGIISASWGGSPAEAWLSLGALGEDASLMPVIARRAQLMNGWANLLLLKEQEKHQIAEAVAAGKPAPQFWHMDLASWRPAGLFDAMIAPITPLPVRGVLWYQAESNSDPIAVPTYGKLFKALITDWRRAWAQNDLPFLFVQLPNFDSGDLWPELREQQAKALELGNTAMAVTVDLGEAHDIHPKNKRDVGERLALAARARVYGEQIEWSGPLFRQAVPEGDGLRIEFEHARHLVSRGLLLKGFELAGADQKFIPAHAIITGASVFVSNDAIKLPAYVRYAWAPNPDCNLYNDANLPVAPFQTAIFLRSDPKPE